MAGLREDLNNEDMLKMREAGMRNSDIATALECSIQIVRNRIGPEPGRRRHYTGFAYSPRPEKSQPVNSPDACLVISNRIVNASGAEMEYEIDCCNGTIKMFRRDKPNFYWIFNLSEVETVVGELNAIARKANDLKVTPEMW